MEFLFYVLFRRIYLFLKFLFISQPQNVTVLKEGHRSLPRVRIGNFSLSFCNSLNPNHSKRYGSIIYGAPEQQLLNQACDLKVLT